MFVFAIVAAGIAFVLVFVRHDKSRVLSPDNTSEFIQKYGAVIRTGQQWFLDRRGAMEQFEINSDDGLQLRACYLPAEGQPKGTIILMHGYRSSCLWDFSCAFELYHTLGYDILAPYQRAHGRSEGTYICFGVKERYDCLRWAQYVNRHVSEDKPIFLGGMSMGATTVLMAAGLSLPSNVRGIIADCGFTSPWEIIHAVAGRAVKLNVTPLMYLMDIFCRIFAGFSMRACSAEEAMKACKLPVLFIHGEADTFVPPEMSHRDYSACMAEKELLTVPGAGHGMSYLLAPERCRTALMRFLDQYGSAK